MLESSWTFQTQMIKIKAVKPEMSPSLFHTFFPFFSKPGAYVTHNPLSVITGGSRPGYMASSEATEGFNYFVPHKQW